MHLINLRSIGTAQLKLIIDSSIRIKQDPQRYEELLKGRNLYMLFERPQLGQHWALGWGLTNSVVGFLSRDGRIAILPLAR